ncbi:hypothetical protein N0V82_007634 [Gnomoniopsis sp. IMI 355080]|nr:hypothetical protein N0V82_007634 [Gnomoniopsis sp. IMI 355080]
MDPPPPKKRRRRCCGRQDLSLVLLVLFVIALVGGAAAAYYRYFKAMEAEHRVQPGLTNGTVVVVVKGEEEISVGGKTDYTYEEQIELPSLSPLPTGISPPAPDHEPSKDELRPGVHKNTLPQAEYAGAEPAAALSDTRPPINKMPRSPVSPGKLPNQPPPFKLPGFIQLPARLVGILKRVVLRLANNGAFPKEIRDVLTMVLHLLDRISKGPLVPHPPTPTGTEILPTLTRPPIGKKPTLPPLPTLTPIPPPPGKGKLPGIRPPPPPGKGKGKLPWPPRPPGKGKGKLGHPRPPGKGKGQVSDGKDELAFDDEQPLSGFVEVTRRATGLQDGDFDTAVWAPAPTAVTDTTTTTTNSANDDNDQGLVELLGRKRPLTKKQRQYMIYEATVIMNEEVEREREANPNDPLNDLINVPTCMAVFSRVSRLAERWMGKEDAAERKAIEMSIVEVADDEDWDYGEGEWF